MTLREYVFKTASRSNLLCQWTRENPQRWILVQLLRARTRGRAEAALFTLHAAVEDVNRFLKEEFGHRYGTYNVVEQHMDFTTVEVTNYLLPAYRGSDPVELTVNLLGPSTFFFPILVHDGYIHITVVATPPPQGRSFAELLKRMTAATNPEDFQLIHTGDWDPLVRLRPRDDHLSERQMEVLKVAVEFGYYDEPRKCTLTEIAKAFGVSKAAIHKRLVAAESKIIKSYRT